MNDQTMVQVAGILNTLLETGDGPESAIYLALNIPLDQWCMLSAFLTSMGYITIKYHWVALTVKGVAQAEKIASVLNK